MSKLPDSSGPLRSASESNITEEEPVDESNVSTAFVPESEKGSFLAFVKKAMGGIDLSKIAAPAFILAPVSLLETNASLMCHPEVFCSIATKETPQERMLAYAQWFISRYHRQSITGSGKKPYNPILGELFHCHFEGPFGKLKMVSEQVSHHPPILAEYFSSEELGIVNMSHFGMKSFFSGTVVKAKVNSRNSTKLIFLNEEYLATFPTFLIRGFFVANPFFDAVGEAVLSCEETGYRAILEYKDKPWFRGEYHSISGRIFHVDNPDKPVYKIDGNWKRQVIATEVATGAKIQLFDKDDEMYDTIVAPIEEQDDLESRKVWKDVTDGLLSYDYAAASAAKHDIEEKQRALAKKRTETGEEFQHRYFYWDEEHEAWFLKDYQQKFEEIKKKYQK